MKVEQCWFNNSAAMDKVDKGVLILEDGSVATIRLSTKRALDEIDTQISILADHMKWLNERMSVFNKMKLALEEQLMLENPEPLGELPDLGPYRTSGAKK